MGNSAPEAKKYNEKTTSTQIAEEYGANGNGKYIVVTGGNSGLGFEAAKNLCKQGANVVIACRSQKLGEEAVASIKAEQTDANVRFMSLDLASVKSVQQFVEAYKSSGVPLNILINNAGVMACPRSLTSDGLEMQFGVNHIGHFVLTTGLLDLIKSSGTPETPSRIINLSSFGNYFFSPAQGLRLDDLNGDTHYDQWERYGSSKLANILFTKGLDKRLREGNFPVVTVSVHPGVIMGTNLNRHFDLNSSLAIAGHLVARGNMRLFMCAAQKTIPEGTATSLFCALSPDIVSGSHYADCAVDTFCIHPSGLDPALAESLWEKSEEIAKKLTDA